MTNEIKVGSRVWREDIGNGTVKDLDIDSMGIPVAAVKFDNGEYWPVSVDLLTLIPDTVTIEIPRELRDGLAEGWLYPMQYEELVSICKASKEQS